MSGKRQSQGEPATIGQKLTDAGDLGAVRTFLGPGNTACLSGTP